MAHSTKNESAWYDLVPLYSQSRLSIRGAPLDKPDAHYKFFSPRPLSDSFFREFSWAVSVDRQPQDLIGNNLSWLIISERAKEALFTIPNLEAEFLELPKFVRADARYRCRAWLFHPMETIRAIDLKRSQLSWSTIGAEHISSIQELCLDRQHLNGASSVFRLLEYEPIVIANSVFKSAWETARCKGIHFRPVAVSS